MCLFHIFHHCFFVLFFYLFKGRICTYFIKPFIFFFYPPRVCVCGENVRWTILLLFNINQGRLTGLPLKLNACPPDVAKTKRVFHWRVLCNDIRSQKFHFVPVELDTLLVLVHHLSQNQTKSHILPSHPPKRLHKAGLCHNSRTFHLHFSHRLARCLHTNFHSLAKE